MSFATGSVGTCLLNTAPDAARLVLLEGNESLRLRPSVASHRPAEAQAGRFGEIDMVTGLPVRDLRLEPVVTLQRWQQRLFGSGGSASGSGSDAATMSNGDSAAIATTKRLRGVKQRDRNAGSSEESNTTVNDQESKDTEDSERRD